MALPMFLLGVRYHGSVSIEESPVPSTSQPAALAHTEPSRTSTQRRVLGLAWPVIGENVLETMLHIVDTVMVAGLGAAAIAGVGVALQVMFFLLAILSALSVGSSVLVAQAIGARNPSRASELARQSLLWSVLLSVPVAVGGVLLAGPVVALFVQSGAIRGIGDTRFPLAVNSVGVWLSAALSLVMVESVGGGLVAVWASFLLIASLIAAVLWRYFRRAILLTSARRV